MRRVRYDELSRARLWFGPSDLGFQVADQQECGLPRAQRDPDLLRRVEPAEFGASKPKTSTFLAAPIDWWNDHYEEVAR